MVRKKKTLMFPQNCPSNMNANKSRQPVVEGGMAYTRRGMYPSGICPRALRRDESKVKRDDDDLELPGQLKVRYERALNEQALWLEIF